MVRALGVKRRLRLQLGQTSKMVCPVHHCQMDVTLKMETFGIWFAVSITPNKVGITVQVVKLFRIWCQKRFRCNKK
jgi:hypothetical protein